MFCGLWDSLFSPMQWRFQSSQNSSEDDIRYHVRVNVCARLSTGHREARDSWAVPYSRQDGQPNCFMCSHPVNEFHSIGIVLRFIIWFPLDSADLVHSLSLHLWKPVAFVTQSECRKQASEPDVNWRNLLINNMSGKCLQTNWNICPHKHLKTDMKISFFKMG